ncbi:MAG: DUF2029 domain-containing protein [Chloroflexaceae bacterium]|nr:DUF2029 domain-containing protein [Chloroflexaceae bacterium]
MDDRLKTILLTFGILALVMGLSVGYTGRDMMPLVTGAQAVYEGKNPYSADVQALIKARYDAPGVGRCPRCAEIGLAYPPSALLLALPVAWLPLAAAELLLLTAGAVVLAGALTLLRFPWWILLFVPILHTTHSNNPSLIITGGLLMLVWMVRARHWWPAAFLAAYLLPIKPQVTAIPVLVAGLHLLAARQWGPVLVAGGVLAAFVGLTLGAWLDWLGVVLQYRDVVSSENTWMWWLIAPGVLLLVRRRWWSGATVMQMGLLPINIISPYSLLPLLLAYTESNERGQQLSIGGSWYYRIGEVIPGGAALTATLMVVGPLVWGALREE